CECEHKPVGCGALAMGQIMWKWQWPQTYNWSNMMNTLHENDTDDIPRLLADCGGKANMNYWWCDGAWTTTNNLVDAFVDFNYKAVDKRVKNDWPNDVWIQIIRNEIDCERPVLYRGGGVIDPGDWGNVHYFVIDGYSQDDFNFF